MAETITLDVERKMLEDLARRRGFESVEAYLLALIERDQAEDDPEAGLREALRDVRAGRVYPIEQLWEWVERDED